MITIDFRRKTRKAILYNVKIVYTLYIVLLLIIIIIIIIISILSI